MTIYVQITVMQDGPQVDSKAEYKDRADSSLSFFFFLFARVREAKWTQPVNINVIFCGDGKIEWVAAFLYTLKNPFGCEELVLL